MPLNKETKLNQTKPIISDSVEELLLMFIWIGCTSVTTEKISYISSQDPFPFFVMNAFLELSIKLVWFNLVLL